VLVYGYDAFPKPPYMASRQLLIPRIVAVGTSFSLLPCQAWHGYGVTNAHRVEVEGGPSGPASAPPPGPPPLRRRRAPQYANVYTGLNVSTALSVLGLAEAHPTETHLHAMKKVVRYLHDTIDQRGMLGG
jgi:hypothetical protein